MNDKPAFDILELSYNWDLPFTWNFPTKNFNVGKVFKRIDILHDLSLLITSCYNFF